MEERIKVLESSNFMQIKDPEDLHQFLSGEFYFFVDSLLSVDSNVFIKDLYNFMKTTFQIII